MTSIQTSAELRMNIRRAFDGMEVEKLQLQGPSGQETDHYGIFMKETGECLPRAFKSSYHPHTLQQVEDLACEAFSAIGQEVTLETSWNNGHVLGLRTVEKISVKNEQFSPEIKIIAKYDGTCGFKALGGMFRMICSNGLVIPVENTANMKRSERHTRSLDLNLKLIQEQMSILMSGYRQQFRTIEKMMDNFNVSSELFLTKIFGERPTDAGRKQTIYDNRQVSIDSIVATELGQLGMSKPSGWVLANAIQAHYQRKQQRTKDYLVAADNANDRKDVAAGFELALATA